VSKLFLQLFIICGTDTKYIDLKPLSKDIISHVKIKKKDPDGEPSGSWVSQEQLK